MPINSQAFPKITRNQITNTVQRLVGSGSIQRVSYNPKIINRNLTPPVAVAAEALENTDGFGLDNTDGTGLENTGT